MWELESLQAKLRGNISGGGAVGTRRRSKSRLNVQAQEGKGANSMDRFRLLVLRVRVEVEASRENNVSSGQGVHGLVMEGQNGRIFFLEQLGDLQKNAFDGGEALSKAQLVIDRLALLIPTPLLMLLIHDLESGIIGGRSFSESHDRTSGGSSLGPRHHVGEDRGTKDMDTGRQVGQDRVGRHEHVIENRPVVQEENEQTHG